MQYQKAYDYYDDLLRPEVKRIQRRLWKLQNKRHLTDKQIDEINNLKDKIMVIETGIVGVAKEVSKQYGEEIKK